MRVKGSPVGVMMAAMIRRTTKACLRYFLSVCLYRSQNLDSNAATVGSSNTTPSIRIKEKKVEM